MRPQGSEDRAYCTTRSIHSLLFDTAVSRSSSIAVVDGRGWSYRELANAVGAFSDNLINRGVARGDRVAVYLENSVESVVALHAVWRAGAIAVPVNPTLKTKQVRHIVSDAGCCLLISADRIARKIDRQALPSIEFISVELCDESEGSFEMLEIATGGDAAAILYTSGSTGAPKGIVVSHANLLFGAMIVAGYLEILPEDRVLCLLPFSFDYGLNQLLSMFWVSGTCVMQRSSLPADVSRAIEAQQVTVLAGVPSLWAQLHSRYSPFFSGEYPSLRIITNSGGRMSSYLLNEYRRRFPALKIYLMYGLTEAFRSTYLDPDELTARPDSIGKAIDLTEVLTINEEGALCGPGETGELVHAGPTVALGYWQRPEETERVFRVHPFNGAEGEKVVYSGDQVRSDEAGFLYFEGRRDAMIKTKGYRVSPDEVEEAIYGSGLVEEAVVVPQNDEREGQIIVAHLVPGEGDWNSLLKQLRGYCRDDLPSYMVPARFVRHDTLPRTASGKFDRQEIASW